MRHRTHRYRQVTAAAVLGMGMTAGVIGLSAGVAGAATASPSGKISAVSAPKITKTGSNETAGDLKITLTNPTATAIATGTAVDLAVATPTGTVDWYAKPTVSGHNVKATVGTAGTSTLALTLGPIAADTTATITVTDVRYSTTGAIGTVTVTPTWSELTSSFTPATAVNAYATHMTPPTPATVTSAKATTTPNLKATGSGQAAGNWTVSFKTATKGDGWSATETISFTVQNAAGTNCSGTSGYVLFTGKPTVTVTATNATVKPTVAVATSAGLNCSAVSHNRVTVTFTNTGMFTNTTRAKNTMKIVLSGVKYRVAEGSAAATSLGYVPVTAHMTTTLVGTTRTVKPAATTGLSNAHIASAYVTANTPAVTVAPGAYDASISPVKLVENTAGTVGTGYECIGLTTATNTFNTSSTATAKATGGNGTVTSKVFYENASGTTITTGNAAFAVFEVTGASTASASTYVVSGLAVNATTTPASVMAKVSPSTTATKCNSLGTDFGTATAYTIGATSKRIAGATAAATASKELKSSFDPTTAGTGTTSGQCVGTTHASTNMTTTTLATATKRVVVLATETHFQDALSSQYLTGYYHTGTLLTQTSTLPSVTVAALRAEGVTRVFVVGGSLAVSNTVVNELKTLPAYTCGGTHLMTTAGRTEHLKVTRLYGYTAEDTAMEIAQAVPSGHVDSLALAGAYAGVNTTGGNGMYNDTPAKASAAPATAGAVKTAILASGTEFQDAMASSALAYSTGVPTLLTSPMKLSTAAADALVNLTIKQVVLMGGTLAVSNTVVNELQKLGVTVLRVAGLNYTDTAVQFTKFLVNTTVGGLGVNWTIHGTVTVTRGNGYTDGLAGAVISGKTMHPLLLTASPTEVGTHLTAFLKASGKTTTGIDGNGRTITTLTILGGSLAVTPAVVAQMQADIS